MYLKYHFAIEMKIWASYLKTSLFKGKIQNYNCFVKIIYLNSGSNVMFILDCVYVSLIKTDG